MGKILLCFLFLGLGFNAFSQKDTLVDLINQFKYSISFDGYNFSGPGWDSVSSHYLNHRIVGLGEVHGTQEVPMFFHHLLSLTPPDHYVTELDSLSLNVLLRDTAEAVHYLKRFPGVFGMYSYQPDFDLITSLIQHDCQFHGLDEIHPISVRLHLVNMASYDGITEKLMRKTKKIVYTHQQALEKGKVSVLNSYKKRVKIKKQLRSMQQDREPIPQAYLQNLITDWKSYSMESRGEKMAIATDSLLLSHPEDRFVFKFGASHLNKVANTARFKDVGGAMDSITQTQEDSSYHLMACIVSGKLALPAKMDGVMAKKFDINTDRYSGHLKPFGQALSEEKHAFFDLKALRKHVEKNKIRLPSRLLLFIKNQDGLVLFKEGSPSPLVSPQ